MPFITRNRFIRVLSAAGILMLGYALYYGWQLVTIGAAYKAKMLCSSVFISKRNPQSILNEELEGILGIIDAEIDNEGRSVTASFPGIPNQRAVFRDGLGCTLLAGATEKDLWEQTKGMKLNSLTAPHRLGASNGFRDPDEVIPAEVPSAKLEKQLNKAFSEADSGNPIRTRAVIIVYNGRIIAERYAPGTSQDTALQGWSMTKSVTNALVGILVKQGKISIYEPIRMPEWSGSDDRRSEITLDQLLRMSSGLKFDDRSGPVVSDVNRMLLRSGNVAAYAIAKPLSRAPETYWYYSSGTTNIISRIIRDCVGGTIMDYFAFPRRALFNKIGMYSAVIEPDASGTFVGSSFMYATARDWARFGLLYLQDGAWEGERILPKGWVSYSSTPTPKAPLGRYGAHFWTNGGNAAASNERPFPDLPADTFYAAGYEGQYIVIIPSRKVVIVRLGQTKKYRNWNLAGFISGILEAISNPE